MLPSSCQGVVLAPGKFAAPALPLDLKETMQQFEIELMSKSGVEREIALAQRKAELELKKQILAITEQVSNADDKAALIEEANAIGERAIAAAKLQALAKSTGEEWARMWGSVEQTGKMAFTQLLGHGKSSFKAIGQAIKASIIDPAEFRRVLGHLPTGVVVVTSTIMPATGFWAVIVPFVSSTPFSRATARDMRCGSGFASHA